MPPSIFVCSPSADAKARFWGRSLNGGGDGESGLGRLGEMRRQSVARLVELAREFERAVADQAGVSVSVARHPAEIVEMVAALAGSAGSVAVNKSGTVATELRPALEARGLRVIDSYAECAAAAPVRGIAAHELCGLPPPAIAGSLAIERWTQHGDAGDGVALLGVSVAAAADGSIYFLEHFSNISRLLAESRAVVVVPLEKIVPTPADARLQLQAMAVHGVGPVMLELAARAGAPRDVEPASRAGGARGVIHVFLLDNGRTTLGGGEHHALLECIGCRACVPVCPTQRFFGGPARQSPRELVLGRLQGREANVALCVLCGMCQAACPLGIDIPRAMAGARAEDARRAGPDVRGWLLSDPERLSRLATPLASLANRALRRGPVRSLMERWIGIARARPLPPFAGESLTAWFRRRPAARSAHGRRVAYYAGCSATHLAPEVGRALVRVLERSGVEVTLPRSRCCGVPQLANGRQEAAIRAARVNVAALAETDGEVVTTCTTCHLALTKVYRDLLGPEAAEVAARTRDASEYLLSLHATGDLDTRGLGTLSIEVAHHTPCHAKAGGLAGQSPALMRLVPGVSVAELDRGCCGIAGTFGMKREHYAQSMEIGAPLVERLRERAAAVATTDCPTCALQMAHGAGRDVVHPVVLLDRAYRASNGDG